MGGQPSLIMLVAAHMLFSGLVWLRGCVRESRAFERLRERAVLSLLPIGREKKAGLSQLSFFKDEVMAFSWPAVSSAFGLGVTTCVFLYLIVYFRFLVQCCLEVFKKAKLASIHSDLCASSMR